jgi:hypothetical protein
LGSVKLNEVKSRTGKSTPKKKAALACLSTAESKQNEENQSNLHWRLDRGRHGFLS